MPDHRLPGVTGWLLEAVGSNKYEVEETRNRSSRVRPWISYSTEGSDCHFQSRLTCFAVYSRASKVYMRNTK